MPTALVGGAGPAGIGFVVAGLGGGAAWPNAAVWLAAVTAATQTVTDLARSFAGRTVVVTVRARTGEPWQFSRFIPEPAP